MKQNLKIITAKQVEKLTIINTLKSQYDFSLYEIELLSGGTESAAWLVKEGKNKWVVKIFGLGEKSEKVKDEVNLYHYLNKHHVHAPVVLPNLSGKELSFADFRGLRFPLAVMRFENLRMCTPTTITHEELVKVASETAIMHKVLLNYLNKNSLMEKSTPAERWLNKDFPKSTFEALIQSVHAQKFSKEQLRRFKLIDKEMEDYIRTHPPTLPLTESIIHADLSLEHAQLLPDGSIYFFDFADRVWGPVAQELATFLTMLYQWEDISFKKWEELKSWVLEGYQAITPLTENDLKAIPQKALIRLLGACKYLAVLTKNTPSEGVVNWISRSYSLGDYICSTN